MRNAAAFILAVATATLVAVCVVQARKSATQQSKLASLQTALDAKSQQADEAQAARQRAEQQRDADVGQAQDLAIQLRASLAAATNVTAPVPAPPPPPPESDQPAAEKGGLGKMFSRLMQNPETRKFVRDQQRVMMDQLYAPLVKRIGLTPEEADQFKDTLADHMMDSAEKAYAMFGGTNSANSAQAAASMAAAEKSFDEQLKAFLGDARYAQYKEYQETAAQRMQLNAFKMQAGSDYTITEPQTEALLTIMKEEQKNVAATTGLPVGDMDKDPSKLQALFTEDRWDQVMQAQATVNERVYDRARTLLAPDQLATFGKFETNQLQMMRASMAMMKGMFGADQPAPPTPASQ